MALAGLFEYFLGKPAEERAPMLAEVTGSVGQRDVERERRKREELAAQQRRRQAQLVAKREPVPPTLRLTPEEQALTAEDAAYLTNVEAARQEIASDNALIDAGLPPFAVRPEVRRNPSTPRGVLDMENALYNSMLESQSPPAPNSASKPELGLIEVPDRKYSDGFGGTPDQNPRTAPLNEEGKALAGLLDSMGQGDMRGRDQRINGISVRGENQSIAAQDPSFLSKLGRGALDYFSDPINRKTLAIGMAGLSANPNRGYQAALQGQIEDIQDQRLLQKSGNATADYLLSQGMVAEAEAVRRNPALSADILALATNRTNAYGDEAGKLAARSDEKLVEDAYTAEAKFTKSKDILGQLDGNTFNFGALNQSKVAMTNLINNTPGLGNALRSTEFFNDWIEKAENTQIIDRALQEGVFAAINDLGIGARGLDTPAERQFLVAVVAGDTNQMESTLRALLEEKMARSERQVTRYEERRQAGELRRFENAFGRKVKPVNLDFLDNDDDEYSGFSVISDANS